MKLIIHITLIIIGIVSIVASGGSAPSNQDTTYDEIDESYYYNNSYSSKVVIEDYNDANKVDPHGVDSDMCWAATAANMAANYTGIHENVYYDELKKNFENKGRVPSVGLSYLGYDNLIVTEFNSINFNNFIKFCINNNRCVAIRIDNKYNNSSHAMTIYGYEQLSDRFVIYVSESSDRQRRLIRVGTIGIDLHSPRYKDYTIVYCLALLQDIL